MNFLKTLCVAMVLIGSITTSALSFDVPELRGHRVNDYAELMTLAEREDLASALRALEEKTTAQVAILTVKDLQGQEMKHFKHTVYTTWKLGQTGKDNGVLIVYSVDDHYGIEVGYGLEGAIPDGVAGDIIRHKLRAKADPKKGLRDFHGAFADAVATIGEKIVAESEAKAAKGDGPSTGFIILVVGAVAIVVVFIIAMIVWSQPASVPVPVRHSSDSPRGKSRPSRSSGVSSNSRSSRRRDDTDSSLLGAAAGASLGSSSSSGSDWGSGSSDSGFSGGGGDSGGGGSSD